jgi:hypothetical protein
VGLYRAVDRHGVVLRLGIGDQDAIDIELGLVDFLLGNLWDRDEDAVPDT